jgi:hypothetical protein
MTAFEVGDVVSVAQAWQQLATAFGAEASK